jgi:hypothetical protein
VLSMNDIVLKCFHFVLSILMKWFFCLILSSVNKSADKLIFLLSLISYYEFWETYIAFAVYLFVHLSIRPHSAFPAFTGQTANRISMKLHRCDQLTIPSLISLARSASQQKMATRAINRKILSRFHRSNCLLDFNETSQE